MAATIEAARLTEAHRLAQNRIGARTVAAMLAVWPLLDLDDLDGTFERWLRTATMVIGSQRDASARLAASYVRTFRAHELGIDAGDFTPPSAGPFPMSAIATSMLVTGPVSVRAAIARRVSLERAAATAQARSARAALRHALNGGREVIVGAVAADDKAFGYARVTSGAACDFCAQRSGMVVAGGADFHSHDSCHCTAEPVYRRDAALPPGRAA